MVSAVHDMFWYLQGGYNLSSISDSAEACLSVMLGDRIPALSTPKPPHKRSCSVRYMAKSQLKKLLCRKFICIFKGYQKNKLDCTYLEHNCYVSCA